MATESVPAKVDEDINKVPLSSLKSIWTAVGLNNQSTRVAAKRFPRSEYPIMWYIGLDSGRKENLVAEEVLSAAQELGLDLVKVDDATSMVGRHIHLYFKNAKAFKEIIKEIFGKGVIHVQHYNWHVEEVSASQLVQLAENTEVAYRNTHKED